MSRGVLCAAQVVCRFRPLNERERKETDRLCVTLDGNGTTVDVVSTEGYGDRHTFHFDKIFGFDSSQEQVYDAVAKPVVDGLFEGYNGTIFAYGQVGARSTTHNFSVFVSMVEIYLEKLRDLLDSTRDSLEVGAMSNVTAVVAGGGWI